MNVYPFFCKLGWTFTHDCNLIWVQLVSETPDDIQRTMKWVLAEQFIFPLNATRIFLY